MWLPFQWGPQTAVATTIGTSSLLAMLVRDQSRGHSAWNHSWFQRAPQPHDPEASEKTWWEGGLKIWVRSREVPCHLSKKVCYHVRSERNSRFSLIQSSSWGLEEANVIILLRNVRPGRTTLHACARLPMRDNNSRFLAAFLDIHSLIMILILANLSSGNLIIMLMVSNSIPRNTIVDPRAFNLWHRQGNTETFTGGNEEI